MEMGKGFAFVERQKRISVDGIDYHLDLLFYHRKLRSLVAIDLKLGKFKPRHKDQNEIRVAQYLTELPSKEWFIDKLQRAIAIAKTNAE